MAPCARLSTAVLPSWVPISCSISSPTISCASPSSSPLEAGACPKTPNRTQSPSENPTKQQEQLQSSMFFSRLLDGKNRRFYLCDQIEDFFGLPRRKLLY